MDSFWKNGITLLCIFCQFILFIIQDSDSGISACIYRINTLYLCFAGISCYQVGNLCFYFCRLAGFEDSGPQEQREFFRKMEKEGRREFFRKTFERDFPELGELMHMVCGMSQE